MIVINSSDANTEDLAVDIQGCSQNSEDSITIEQDLLRPSHMCLDAKEMLKDEMSKVINLLQNKERTWEIEADIIHDFKYYFKKYNPEKMSISLKKANGKKRNVTGGSRKAMV